MRSRSKTLIGRELAETIVRDAFDGAELATCIELTEGWFNAAYLLTLADGSQSVLKVAPPPEVAVLTYERDIMATEVAALGVVREHTSVPVPRVLWSDPSCRHVPSPFFIMECCKGELLNHVRSDLDEAQQGVVDAQLAGFLRQMNALAHPTFGLQSDAAARFSTWREAFISLLNDVLADAHRASVTLPLADDAFRFLVQDRVDVFDEVSRPSFVHWDLWDGNVFIDPQTLVVTGIIDFERALWGDPLMEAQFLWRANDTAFLDAYGLAMLSSASSVTRRLLYDVYLFLIMVVEATYREYPTDEMETFARERLQATLKKLDATG